MREVEGAKLAIASVVISLVCIAWLLAEIADALHRLASRPPVIVVQDQKKGKA